MSSNPYAPPVAVVNDASGADPGTPLFFPVSPLKLVLPLFVMAVIGSFLPNA